MPGNDRTGPLGMGPRTGRGTGFCSGYATPLWTNLARPRLARLRVPGLGWRRAIGAFPRIGRGLGAGQRAGRGAGFGRDR